MRLLTSFLRIPVGGREIFGFRDESRLAANAQSWPIAARLEGRGSRARNSARTCLLRASVARFVAQKRASHSRGKPRVTSSTSVSWGETKRGDRQSRYRRGTRARTWRAPSVEVVKCRGHLDRAPRTNRQKGRLTGLWIEAPQTPAQRRTDEPATSRRGGRNRGTRRTIRSTAANHFPRGASCLSGRSAPPCDDCLSAPLAAPQSLPPGQSWPKTSGAERRLRLRSSGSQRTPSEARRRTKPKAPRCCSSESLGRSFGSRVRLGRS